FSPITTDSIHRRVASVTAASSTIASPAETCLDNCCSSEYQWSHRHLRTPGVPPMSTTHETDVVVIGGGPAGSTVSTLLAQHGLRVELFERERFPRFHIGESLIPETYWVFRRLHMLDKMKASAFVKKFSVQFVSATGKESAPFYFHDNKAHECSQTWLVIRSE